MRTCATEAGICGLYLLVHALEICFWHISLHIEIYYLFQGGIWLLRTVFIMGGWPWNVDMPISKGWIILTWAHFTNADTCNLMYGDFVFIKTKLWLKFACIFYICDDRFDNNCILLALSLLRSSFLSLSILMTINWFFVIYLSLLISLLASRQPNMKWNLYSETLQLQFIYHKHLDAILI